MLAGVVAPVKVPIVLCANSCQRDFLFVINCGIVSGAFSEPSLGAGDQRAQTHRHGTHAHTQYAVSSPTELAS